MNMDDKKDINIKKNDELIIEIHDIGQQGEGIGEYKGYTLFVNNSTLGDKVKVKVMKTKKNYGFCKTYRNIRTITI